MAQRGWACKATWAQACCALCRALVNQRCLTRGNGTQWCRGQVVLRCQWHCACTAQSYAFNSSRKSL
jgi:hypothetical protein